MLCAQEHRNLCPMIRLCDARERRHVCKRHYGLLREMYGDTWHLRFRGDASAKTLDQVLLSSLIDILCVCGM